MSDSSVQAFPLRAKLLLLAASLVLIPGAIYGAIAVSNSRATLADVVGSRLVEEAHEGADRLATALRSERERLESLAGQDVMREIRIGDLDKRISSLLASALRGCQACVELQVVGDDGRVVAASNPSSIGTDLGRAQAAQPTFEGPSSSGAGGTALIRVTTAVPDPDARPRPIGRLVALLDWNALTRVLAGLGDNEASAGLVELVVGRDGVVIGGASHDGAPWQTGDRLELKSPPAGRAASTRYIDSDAAMLVGYAPLPADVMPWTVVIAEPLATAFQPASRMARRLAAVLAVTLLVALVVAVVAASRASRPLVELSLGARAVGAGQRPVPVVAVRSRDEIGSLALAFNRMGRDLERAERELVDAAKFSFAGELAAGVAHEVRTPLGVMRSAAQLLERSLEPRDDEARELLNLLRDEVDRIDRVVSALLELGRPRQMQPEPAALGQIVFRAADFVETQARQRRISIQRSACDPDPVVSCDPELIHQVALNLLVNAVQILPDGGSIHIVVDAVRGGSAAFEIRDDGPGMSEDVQAHIFEPFFTRRAGGAGLGLTFVQRVVQEHRGRVTVNSSEGGGTMFRVELPAAGGGQ